MQKESKTVMNKCSQSSLGMRQFIILSLVFLAFLLVLCSCTKKPFLKTKEVVSLPPKKAVATTLNNPSCSKIEDLFCSRNTNWKTSWTIPEAKFIEENNHLGYEFVCDFSKVKERCVWDAGNLNIDLSEKSFISFDADVSVPSAIRIFTFYLRFGEKWIYPPIKLIEGHQKVIIDLNTEKFRELKKSPVTTIRISPWKANNNSAKIVISNVNSGSGKVLAVPNKVWYKKEEKIISAKDFDLSLIKNLEFKNYSTSNHLFLIGKPAKIKIHKGFLNVPKDLSIECEDYDIDKNLKDLIKKYASSSSGAGKIKVNCKIDPDLSIPGKVSDENVKRFKSKEAYYLNINSKSITLTGKSHFGILRGLASIALIGSSQKSKKEQIINCAEIWEAPSVKVRMYEGAANLPMPKRREIVDMLYLLRYNTHVMQLLGYVGEGRTTFPFDSLPDDLRPNSTKKEWKELMKYYKSRGIEFIPKTFTFSRAGILLSRPEYKHLAETDGLNNANHKEDKNNKNFCSSNPKSYELIFGLLTELIDTLNPKTIHVGLDEVSMGNTTCKTHCPPSKKKSDWLKDVVLKTHAFLKSKDVSMLMYGDMLDPYHHGGQIGINDWKFANNLPKDIIIGDWKYDISDQYPSISKFTKLGFRTLGLPWDQMGNWFGIISQLIKDDAYGLCGTSWGAIHPSRVYNSRASTISLGASLCWSPLLKNMGDVPVQPVSKIYKQLCYPNKMGLPYAKKIEHITLKKSILTDEKLAEAI
ncbi:MAG: family 20 glycosylhydrolase, partial [Verrucomicrobiota bacterium]|nr:family 20 glycosylhydrolase [Verrucomicrobiota bacterium]